MKHLLPSTKQMTILILAFIMGSGLVMAQSRYKHVPRVKVDIKHTSEKRTPKTDKINFTEVAVQNQVEVSENMNVNQVPVEVTEVASTSNESVVLASPKTKKSVTKTPQVTEVKAKKKFDMFGDHFNFKAKLLKVKSVEKTQGTVGIILLIAFYVLSILFTVLCIVFLLDPNPASFTLFLVFLILAIVFAIAGSIMLTLLKLGVI